ncbi:MAG: hypothetical protein AAF193_05570, partial [Bacteroidota bacterium]
MCGFSGVVSTKEISSLKEALHSSLKSIQHRGPDDQKSLLKDRFGLVHARLAIIDPRESIQPMSSEHHHLAFNGEVYNFEQLKATMIQNGVSFSTSGDTEVVLKGLQLEGVNFLQKIEGCYALAFVNATKSELILARDPMGINPLFISQSEDCVYFSSEVQGLIPFLGPIELSKS